MNTSSLETAINDAWEQRESINGATSGEIREAVDAALDALDTGEQRVAENGSEGWRVNQWLKKAVLLSFRLNDMSTISGGPGPNTTWYDSINSRRDHMQLAANLNTNLVKVSDWGV